MAIKISNVTVIDNDRKLFTNGGELGLPPTINTASTDSSTSHLIIKRSGAPAPTSFGAYDGAWRSGIEVWNNDSTRMLFLNPPDAATGIENYAHIKAVGGGIQFGVGALGATSGLLIDSAGTAKFTQNINIDGTLGFRRGTDSYTTYIRSNGYPAQGYPNTDGNKYWVELGSAGGVHVVLNTDGSSSSVENSYDHFTVWQGSNEGTRVHWTTNVGHTTSIGSVRSPIFYDSNDTNYYIDPNSTSYINSLYIQGGVGGLSNSSSYTEAAIEIRERNFGGAQDDTWATAPRLSFHWGGRVASQIALASNARIHVLNNPGDGNESLQVASLYGTTFYDTNDTNFYLDPASTTTSLQIAGAIEQGSDFAHPNIEWSAPGNSTGMVVFKLPGTSGNYGMVHMVFDYYEYDSAKIATIIVGGYNWNTGWYNVGCNVIGNLPKQVRLGYVDGQYCVVFGAGDSSWTYGTIRLRKIHNASFYNNIMNLGGAYGVTQVTSASFTNITGDLRELRTPATFTAGGPVSGSRLWAGYDSGETNSVSSSNWFRSSGNTGWYNASYAGGIYMIDTTWVRVYGNKQFYNENFIQSDSSVKAPIFYDSNDTNYYIDAASTSNLLGLTVTNTITGNISGNAATVTNGVYTTSNVMLRRGDITDTTYNSATTTGLYAVNYTGYSRSLMVWNTGGSTGIVQLDVNYGDSGEIRLRNATDSVTWSNWRTFLTNQNYNSYSPTLTGTGASGSWGISITGNAATATTTNNITNVGFNNSNSGNPVSAPDSLNSNGIGYVTNVSLLGQTDGALYSQAYSSSWQHQIYGDYRTGQMAIRGKNSGTWQAWRTVLDSSNYSSYALPLSGGTVTGVTTFTNASDAQIYLDGAGTTWAGIRFSDVNNNDFIWYNGTFSTFSIGGGGAVVSGKKLHINGGTSIGSGIGSTAVGTNSLLVEENVSAKIFYDSNDTNYYVDPASTSVLYSTQTSLGPRNTNTNWNTAFQNTPVNNYTWHGDISSGGPSGTWWFYESMRHSNSNNFWGTQIAWGWEDNANELYQRNVTGGTFGGWVRYLNTNNYNSYAPTLTGTGASGTWGINISGNAATVTNGVYTNGSYANPSWITSLAETKVLPSQATHTGKFLTTDGTSTSWSTVSGGINYTKVTNNTTLVDKQGVIADTSGGTFTVTLPATPTTGVQVSIVDGANWSTTNLTVARNGSTIESLAEDLVLDIGGAKVDMIYDGTTWEVYTQVGVGGSAVDLSSAQTLTNKTLTSPVISNTKITGLRETTTVSATAATGTINYDYNTQSVLYYTTNASGNFTINVRGDSGTTLNSKLGVGESVTVVFMNTNGGTAYYHTGFQVDGTSVTPKWQGGTAPSSGNTSSIDIYTYTIIKTASTPSYTVLASQTKFA